MVKVTLHQDVFSFVKVVKLSRGTFSLPEDEGILCVQNAVYFYEFLCFLYVYFNNKKYPRRNSTTRNLLPL
jgi:hypothetical protein